MRFVGRRDGVDPELVEQMALGRGDDRRQRAHHAVRGLQLRRAGGDPRRRASASQGGGEEEFRELPLRARDARPRPDHPHQRRAAPVQLPALAVGLLASCTSRDVLWPDFSREDFEESLAEYDARRRRSAAADGRDAPRRRAPRGRRRSRRRRRGGSDLRRAHPRRAPGDRVRDLHRRSRAAGSSRPALVRRSACVCLHELFRDVRRARPVRLAGFAGRWPACAVAAQYGGQPRCCWSLVALAAAAVPARARAAAPARRTGHGGHAARRLWIGLAARARGAAARAAARRRRSSSTCSSARSSATPAPTSAGARSARRPLAPRISPNKTVEGLVIGIVVRRRSRVWFAGLYQDWLLGRRRAAARLRVALAAPVGDLFESLVKRDARRQGLRRAVRRPRRRARPPRRGAVHGGRRLLRLACAFVMIDPLRP